MLSSLADILNVSVDELLGRESGEVKEEKPEPEVQTEHASEVVDSVPDKDKVDANFTIEITRQRKILCLVTSILFGLALLAYILVGIFWTDQNMGWKMCWLFLFIPAIVSSLIEAIQKKRFTHFGYPILALGTYFTLGFLGDYLGFQGWEVYWFLFITIPIYYCIFGPIDKLIKMKQQKSHPCDEDDDDDEDDEKEDHN